MVLGKNAQNSNNYELAATYYKAASGMTKAALGAEARYEVANCYYQQNKLKDAEKAAFEVINKAGSYAEWVTKAYLLLGDIYFKQKDYFNAKATYQSVLDNATLPDLKEAAQKKLAEAKQAEEAQSKIEG